MCLYSCTRIVVPMTHCGTIYGYFRFKLLDEPYSYKYILPGLSSIIRIRICIATNTAPFTYYHDPVILQNKFTPLSISRDLALRN